MRTETTVDIDRPASDVFAFIADASNNPQWQGGMVKCEWTSPPPIDKGSTYEQHARFMGRDIRSTFEITAYEADRRIRGESTSGPFPIIFTRSVAPRGDQTCRVTAIVEGDASGFFRLADPLLRWMVSRSVAKDYRKLKALLESS